MKRPLNQSPDRRTFLSQSMAAAGLLTLSPLVAHSAADVLIANITGLYSVAVAREEKPLDAQEISILLRAWPGQVSVGGGRYSMGGQIAIERSLHLDMRAMNKLVWIRSADKRVRVQAGMRWRDLQDILDPLDLSVMTMQSYSNFTVGGSVSVNAHGRYVSNGPVGNSVLALQLVLADGSVIEASRDSHPALFGAAVGGYGAVGVITEVELMVRTNLRMERVVVEVPLNQYVAHLDNIVLSDPSSVMHNADLMPPNFNQPVSVTWRQSKKPLTESARLVPRGQRYALEQNVLWALTELPGGQHLRKTIIHPLLAKKPVVKWLNHEASLDAAELEPRTRRTSTYVLQEYFVPKRNFLRFVHAMAHVLKEHSVEAVNISIRHSPKDQVACLPWAKEEVLSFVLYYKQRTHLRAQDQVASWTQELIDAALSCEGRYYLPYQLHATRSQFERAYPEVVRLRQIKKQWDPQTKFSNSLWAKYL